MQHSQQQCNKEHSAVNSLTVLHIFLQCYRLTSLYITPALQTNNPALQTNKTGIKYQLSSYFIVNVPTMSLPFLALNILMYCTPACAKTVKALKR